MSADLLWGEWSLVVARPEGPPDPVHQHRGWARIPRMRWNRRRRSGLAGV